MIVKFFRHGNTGKGKSRRTGGGNSVRDYLLGKNKDRENATLIKGDPDQTTEVINGIKNKSIYTSGVLSFSKDELVTDEQKQQIIADFEKTLFPNLDPDQFSSYWVEHQDKDRLEMHFVFANIELTTGKALPVYYARNDLHLIDSWKNLTNARYDLADPNSPSRAWERTPTKGFELKDGYTAKTGLSDEAQKDQIHNKILAYIELDASVKTRDDVVKTIKSLGYEVTRQSKKDNTISIKNPNGGRNLKLRGDIYAPNFDRDQHLPQAKDAQQKKYDSERADRLAQAKADYERNLAYRAERLSKRFKLDRQPLDNQLTHDLAQIRADNEPLFTAQLEAERLAEQQAQLAEAQRLAQLEAEQERQQQIQSQLEFMLDHVGEVLPQASYVKWQALSDTQLADYLTDYRQQGQSLLDKAHREILDPDTLAGDKVIKDVIATIEDITAVNHPGIVGDPKL